MVWETTVSHSWDIPSPDTQSGELFESHHFVSQLITGISAFSALCQCFLRPVHRNIYRHCHESKDFHTFLTKGSHQHQIVNTCNPFHTSDVRPNNASAEFQYHGLLIHTPWQCGLCSQHKSSEHINYSSLHLAHFDNTKHAARKSRNI